MQILLEQFCLNFKYDFQNNKERNGEIADFRPKKIQDAIAKAVQAVGGNDLETPELLTRLVIKEVEKNTPTTFPGWKGCRI